MIDLIGDIHGHADKLEALLIKLGYAQHNGVYAHPERKVLFIGDYIDRGPKIRETLQIVKSMVDSGNAIALMGNHEYNAICFHVEENSGGHLRKHLIKNVIQHYETLRQFQNKQQEYEQYVDWFKTLPLYYENDSFRAVHACWDNADIQLLRNTLVNDRLTDELIHLSVMHESPLHHAIERTLKGKEMQLPAGVAFSDKDGTTRTDIRIKWWEDPTTMTYHSISVEPLEQLPESPLGHEGLTNSTHYLAIEKPVFFGHYWLKGQPTLWRENVCCIDYSVAKGGLLVAYRFDGERLLDKGKFVWV